MSSILDAATVLHSLVEPFGESSNGARTKRHPFPCFHHSLSRTRAGQATSIRPLDCVSHTPTSLHAMSKRSPYNDDATTEGSKQDELLSQSWMSGETTRAGKCVARTKEDSIMSACAMTMLRSFAGLNLSLKPNVWPWYARVAGCPLPRSAAICMFRFLH